MAEDFLGIFPDIKGFEIISLLGESQRSRWYIGNQASLGRRVALKCLRPELSRNQEFRQLFLASGRQTSGIVHPNVLSVINIFPEEACIVREWCPARALKDHADTVPGILAIKVGVGVLDGLAALHATNRAHGNLSPGNIFLDPEGRVTLDDFFQPPVFPTLHFVSSANFVAPEVIAGGGTDWRSDLYSLGKILAGIITPDDCPPDLTALMEEITRPDPAARGDAPTTIAKRLGVMRRVAEEKIGVVNPTGSIRQRQYHRISSEIGVTLKRRSTTPAEVGSILSRIQNISENGVFVTSQDNIPVGSIVELNFSLPDEYGSVAAFGLVRWVSEMDGGIGMGVQFVEFDASGIAALRDYLTKRDRVEPSA
ncbi:MAG: PilZ domain-containing protein [Planctomycetota bacterium]|jgi:serine/threonine protein kinase|nr:PilZ domain-containing protein [Planctomycetota bacterium]